MQAGREPGSRGASVVVGVALVDRRGAAPRVLAAQRSRPAALAGLWEFPGGKVELGEGELDALVRECREELGCAVTVGTRLGDDVTLPHGAVLRVWTGTTDDAPRPLEHLALRWLGAHELDDVPWIPADAPLVDALRARLAP